MEPLKHLCPYIRLAIDQTLYLPWRLPERIIFDYELVYIKKGRVRQNYLRRKQSGKQKEYEDRIKSEKQRQMEAKKAALRAEDMSKGIYTTVTNLPSQKPQKNHMVG